MRRGRATTAGAAAVLAATLVLAACRSDGREMRAPIYPPPATAATTTVVPLATG